MAAAGAGDRGLLLEAGDYGGQDLFEDGVVAHAVEFVPDLPGVRVSGSVDGSVGGGPGGPVGLLLGGVQGEEGGLAACLG